MRLLSTAIIALLAVCTAVNAALLTSEYTVKKYNPLTEECIGYQIDLTTPGAFDVLSANSDYFTLDVAQSNDTTLYFYGGTLLPIGGKVQFDFNVIAPDTNPTSDGFTYTAIAVPEPGVMSLLGLGAFGLLKRRSR